MKTLRQHEKEKKHSWDTKMRYGRQNNSYASDSLRLAAYGDQIAKERFSSLGAGMSSKEMQARDMPNATGSTRVAPDRLTTVR